MTVSGLATPLVCKALRRGARYDSSCSKPQDQRVPRRPPPAPLPPQPSPRTVASFKLRGFWDEMAKRGVSIAELQRLTGASPPHHGDYTSVVTEPDMHHLFEVGMRLSGDTTLGLSVGRAIGAASFHLLGLMALASATLPQAVSLAARADLHSAARAPRIENVGDGQLGFGLFSPKTIHTRPGARFEAEMTAALLYEVELYFLDRKFGTPSVHFAFPAPADASAYRMAFPGGVHFGAPGTFIVFPSKAMRRRRSGSDPNLLRQLSRLAEEQYTGARPDESWSSRVRGSLRNQPAPRLTSADAIAKQFGLSPRALSRRLSSEGKSLSELLEEVLYERAKALLLRPRSTSAQVAEALGYAEVSSFFRAFRRWSDGLTPSSYKRARHGS
jgi:AraC-like DNA-binding protein